MNLNENNSETKLTLDWCSYKAALYACKNWHYSKRIPAGKLTKIGVWENDIYIGVVIFSRGANPNLLTPYELKQNQGCELTRIALNKHISPVTKIVSLALKKLKEFSPGLKLVVSFSDLNQGHLGKIYQAGNWIYAGASFADVGIYFNKEIRHRRSIVAVYGTSEISILRKFDPEAKVVKGLPKLKYLMPLDKQTKKKVKQFSQPYISEYHAED